MQEDTWDVIIDYARVSSEEQTDGQALEQQIARLSNAYPSRTHLFQDVQSGSQNDRRSYLLLRELVRTEARAGKKVLVRTTRLDRLSRDDHEIDRAVAEWDALGVVYIALDGGIYTHRSAQDWLRTKQEGVFATYFLRQLSGNIRRGKEYKRKQGRPLGIPPFGYKFNDDKTQFIRHPQNWDVARSLIVAYLPVPMGKSLPLSKVRSLAAEYGWDASVSGLRLWMLNPVLRGHLTSRQDGWSAAEKKANVKKPLVITHWDVHEPLITEAEFRLIEKQLEENRRNWGRHVYQKSINPLAGLCYCADCGYRLRYNRRKVAGREYVYLVCQYKDCVNTGVCPEEVLESAIVSRLKQYAGELAEALAEPDEGPKESPEVQALKRDLEQLQAMQAKSSVPSLLASAIAELEATILRKQSQEKHDKSKNLIDHELIDEALALFSSQETWEQASPENKKIAYQGLIKGIWSHGKEVTQIEMRF